MLALFATTVVAGCRQPDPIQLVPVAGCGIDQTFSGLRVRVLGDFPPSSSTELFLGAGQTGEIEDLPAGATGIAAEGVFGMTITAIGRSYGVDPDLATGRIPGVDGAAFPVYFAAPESMCAVAPEPSGRNGFAWAHAPSGEVLLVGGRLGAGLVDEPIAFDVLANTARTLEPAPDTARVGHTAHPLGPGRFVVIGGARAGDVLDDALLLTLSGDSLAVEARSLDAPLAHHAAAGWADRVLVAGGCNGVDGDGACIGEVEPSAAWIDLDDELARTDLAPLSIARAGGLAFVSSDGTAFVAGGTDADGVGLASVERMRVGADAWETVVEFDADALVGLAVLDGQLVLAAATDGSLHWWSEGGTGTLDPSLRAPMLAPTGSTRPLLVLPGERVLVDTWLFAPASAALDPSVEIIDLVGNVADDATPGRSGGASLVLGDGSLLLAGGISLAGELPFLARVRPALDGPDERVPELAAPDSDAFVSNTPGAVAVEVGGLRLTGAGGPAEDLPTVHAHVRGFRSRSFQLEFESTDDPGNTGWIVVGQGAEHAVVLALRASGVEVARRAGGEVQAIDCGSASFTGDMAAVLEVEESGERIRLIQGEATLVDCLLDQPWPDTGGLHVGFGVSGSGDRTFRSLRLARL